MCSPELPPAGAGLAGSPAVVAQEVGALEAGGVVSRLAEQIGDRGERRHLRLLQAELDDVGREHERAAFSIELLDVRLLVMPLVGAAVAVDLIQDALHGRRRDRMHYEDQGVWFAASHLRNDTFGQPIELVDTIFEERVDGDLAKELARSGVAGSPAGRACEPVRAASVPGVTGHEVAGGEVPGGEVPVGEIVGREVARRLSGPEVAGSEIARGVHCRVSVPVIAVGLVARLPAPIAASVLPVILPAVAISLAGTVVRSAPAIPVAVGVIRFGRKLPEFAVQIAAAVAVGSGAP